MGTQQNNAARPLDLIAAQKAAQRGDPRRAHQICLDLMARDPKNEAAWLCLAETSVTLQERISILDRVIAMNPSNRSARLKLYKSMQELLTQDPTLIYQGETNSSYQIRTPSDFQFDFPKDRAEVISFPMPSKLPMPTAYRWLGWALLGLIPVGLGALVCAPLAGFVAIKILSHPASLIDRRRAWVILTSASAIWLVGLFFSSILVMHII